MEAIPVYKTFRNVYDVKSREITYIVTSVKIQIIAAKKTYKKPSENLSKNGFLTRN